MAKEVITAAKPTKGARTRERIIQAAADLFHERGMNATSLGDILAASETGKGQFYQHFKSRDNLVAEVLRYRRFFFEEQIKMRPITSWEELRAWMDSFLVTQRGYKFTRGCPIGTAISALRPDQESERQELLRLCDAARENLTKFFKTEKTEGRLKTDADTRALANFAIACVQGGVLLNLLERKPKPGGAAIDEGFSHLRSYAINDDREQPNFKTTLN